MKMSRRLPLIIVGMLICFGCAGTGSNLQDNILPPKEGGGQKLSEGIKSFEEGNYEDSLKLLQEALAKELPNKGDEVEAHKYLAFIYCVSDREKECTNEFKKILELDPNFELQAAEAGHPLWGPVYGTVKGTKATPATISSISPPKEEVPPSILVSKEAQAAEPTSALVPSPKILVVLKTSNMRAEADGKSKIIRILKKGERVEYLGKSKSGNWFNCKLTSGMTGWIFKDLVQEAK